jgi:hypothetical protein
MRMQITWTAIDQILQWLARNARPVALGPGATQRYYVNMGQQVLLAMRIPQLHTSIIK